MPSHIVQELRNHLDHDLEFKGEFEKAFKNAMKACPRVFKEENIETLNDYFNFYERLLKWVPEENMDGTFVINRLCLFYYVLDTLPVSCRQSPIRPDSQPGNFTWLSKWIIRYAREMGKWMDSPESIDECKIRTFYLSKKYHMEDYDCVKWKTFNEFFARHIKPECRPIQAPSDDKVIVSPADATFDNSWSIDSSSDVEFSSKGIPWSISQLLDDRSSEGSLGARFAGGKFCHAFLGPWDYHRQHAPVSGRVLEAKVIEGLCYLEVVVVPDSDSAVPLFQDVTPRNVKGPHLAMRRTMAPTTMVAAAEDGIQAPNSPGYQFIQARGLILIDNPQLGHVAVLPIGMAQVSSVKLSVQKHDYVQKGQEISYFQFGGSDVVVVFEARANVDFTVGHGGEWKVGQAVAHADPIRTGH